MSNAHFADRSMVEASVHAGTVELMLCQARFVEELTHPKALVAAIAARSPAERKALARLGRALALADQLVSASSITSPAT